MTPEEKQIVQDVGTLLSAAVMVHRLNYDALIKALQESHRGPISDNLVLVDLARAFKSVVPAIDRWAERGDANLRGIVNAQKN